MIYHNVPGYVHGCLFFLLAAALHGSSAATVCPTDFEPIPANFLEALNTSQTNVFYPSAYFVGSAVRMVSATGLTSFYSPLVCVDGETVASTIHLRDDGKHGDDVAGDGLYTRRCVHFCESSVDFADVWNYAYHQTIQNADLIAVTASLQGEIPYDVIQSPKYPEATVYATSHAAFFVDDQRHYMPGWPNEKVWDYAGARNVATSTILDIFGDVFDWFSMTAFDFSLQFCENCKAIPGAYNTKYHGWEWQGGTTAFRRVGELSDCDFAMTGFPVLRMVGGVSNEDMLTEFLGQTHEWLHGSGGYSYQRYLSKARQGDGMHVPGACTTDHSPLQGPLWDWVEGYPKAVPVSYCVNVTNCNSRNYDRVRLEANRDCDKCPDADLADCCSFRYEDAIHTREEMLKKPELFQASPLIQYIAGILPIEDLPLDKQTYYCMGSDTDGGCGLNGKLGNCTIPVDDSERSHVTSTYVSRFTLDDLVESVGGLRDPPARKERDFRSAPILIGQRIPSEAEMVFYTQWWRFQEQESKPWSRKKDSSGNRRIPLFTWQYTTNGRSTIHSKYHNIPCGGGLQVQSCQEGTTVCDDFACGGNATCYPFDGRPLCVCNDGYWGDGNVCVEPSVPASYDKIYPYLWSAHDIYFNGTDLEYYPKYTVKEWCFGDINWPNYTSPSKIAPYPGGMPKYALTGCGKKVCPLSKQCVKGSCVSIDPTSPTDPPSQEPTMRTTFEPTVALTSEPQADTVTLAAKLFRRSIRKCGCEPTNVSKQALKRYKTCLKQLTSQFIKSDQTLANLSKPKQEKWSSEVERLRATQCTQRQPQVQSLFGSIDFNRDRQPVYDIK